VPVIRSDGQPWEPGLDRWPARQRATDPLAAASRLSRDYLDALFLGRRRGQKRRLTLSLAGESDDGSRRRPQQTFWRRFEDGLR